MAHLPAILIVLTLTGQPVANALCDIWCDLPSERQTCGDAIAQPTSETVVASSTCGALLTESPFLKEEGRSALHVPAVLHGVQASAIAPTGGARLAHTRSGDANGGRLPPLVLRV